MFPDLFPAGAVPYAELAPWAIAAVFAMHFMGFFIRGAFGFGSNMPIVLVTTWILGPHHAILLVLLCTFAAQVHLLPQGLKTADWEVTRPLVAGVIVGITTGTWLFTILAADWLTLVMGSLITFIIVMDSLKVLQWLSARIDLRSRWVTSSLAAGSSVVGAVSGGGAFYFLVIYLKLACKDPAGLRGTNLALSAVFIVGRIILLSWYGLFTPQLLAEASLLLPVVFLGTWSGTRFFHTSSPERFYIALQILLFCAAIALLGKGIMRVI